MHKITYLLSLFLLMVGTAVAQTQVTDLSQLVNTKAYTLQTSRSDLVTKADGLRIATTNDISGTFDASNTQYQFALLTSDTGVRYLYSISASKFVNKTGDLVDNPSDPIYFKAGNAENTFLPYFDNTHYMNMGGSKQLAIDGWSTADVGNSYTITEVADFTPSEELLASLNSVEVTVNFIVGGTIYKTLTKSYIVNTAVQAALFEQDLAITYLTYASADVETITAEVSTVNVTCTSSLPFVLSESYENATWYMVNMHKNNGNIMWTADLVEGVPTLTVVNKGEVYSETVVPDDTRLWCFVGDIHGFKIYNKAVGSAYTMNKTSDGDNAISWGDAASGTLYQLHKTASGVISGGFSFLPQGHTYYLNHRGTTIQGWNARDEGSTCLVYAPDAFLLNYANAIVAGPAGSLGTARYFNTAGVYDSYKDAIAAANANHFDISAASNLAAILADYAASTDNATPNATTLTDGGYYRLLSCAYNNYMTAGVVNGNNALQGNVASADALSQAATVVKFVADGDNYKLYVQGLEVGETSISSSVQLNGGGIFTITNNDNKYVLKDVSTGIEGWADYRYLHCDASSKIVGWEPGAEASKWYIVPATDLEVALNAADDKTYATAYLPFDVTLPADNSVKAFIVNAAAGDMATLEEVADVPAGQGVILQGQSAADTKVVLTIGTAAANCSANLLSGSNLALTIEEDAKADYFVLGSGANGVGLYHPNSTTLKANRAFLSASNVAAAGGANGLRFDFGGVNTGIETAVATDKANAGAIYYDLTGRRVLRPAKGIYVKDGKKVYVY